MISGSNISNEDILEYQRYLKGFLVDKVPEADLTDGSFLTDVVIKSMAYVVALFDEESNSIKNRLSVNTIADLEDLTSVQVLDNIAANFFLSRKDGQFATGIIRVVLNSNERSVVITPQTRFTKAPGVHFMYAGGVDGETSLIVKSTDLVEIFDSEGNSTQTWYLEVPVIGESIFLGSSLSPGKFQSVNPSIPNLVRAENSDPFTPADELETNLEFADRVKSAITNRGMSSSSGIKVHLLDTISSLRKIEVIGSTSNFMRRDLLESGSVISNFKTLGKCNIYTSLSTVKQSVNIITALTDLPAESGGTLTIDIPRSTIKNLQGFTSIPGEYTRIDKFYDPAGNLLAVLKDNVLVNGAGADYVEPATHLEYCYLDVTDSAAPNTRGEFFARTNKEKFAIKIAPTNSDVSISLGCLISIGSDLVEAEIGLEDNIVPGLDLLNYSFTVKNLHLDIHFYKNQDATTVPIELLKSDLSSFINSFCEQNINITLAEIYNYILDEYATYISGIDFSDSYCEFSMFLPNGRTVVMEVGSTTGLSSSSTKEYYRLSSGGLKVYDYLSSFSEDKTEYFTRLQVGDSTCKVHLLPENINFVEVS